MCACSFTLIYLEMHASCHPMLAYLPRAQRKDRLYLTFDLQDCKDPTIEVKNDEASQSGRVSFKGNAHSHATGAAVSCVGGRSGSMHSMGGAALALQVPASLQTTEHPRSNAIRRTR